MDSHDPKQAGSDDALLKAIEAIYGCVTEPSDLERLPETLAPLLDARTVSVWCLETDLEPVAVGSHGLPESALQDYLDNWIHSDPLMSTGLERLGVTITPEWMLGDRGYRDLPVFDGFYARYDIARQMARFDFLAPRWIAGVSFQRARADRPIGDGAQRRLEILSEHLRRAWTIAIRMGVLASRARGAEALLSTCRLATWLLDDSRRVHASNEAAERMATTHDSGIVSTGGALRFADPELDAAFRTTLEKLEAGQRTPAELPLLTDRRRPFSWGVLVPLDHDEDGAGVVQWMYVLVLARPGADANIDWHQLERRLPISRAEADVLARLMRAEEPTTIAEARGSTHETIRGYEKSLRNKLACHSRAELVSRGWRTVAAIPCLGAGP